MTDEPEDCDDGNDVDGDGCESDCSITPGVCGNGVTEDDEECDDGNRIAADGCEPDCLPSEGGFCGDGELGDAEACDEGTENSNGVADHCREDCTEPRCVMNDAEGSIATVDNSTGRIGPECRAELDRESPAALAP